MVVWEPVVYAMRKREGMIKEKEGEIEKLESDFKTFVEGLQKQYQDSK